MRGYRNILKDEYFSRISSNPAYSLRAFSRDLSISVSQLSLILNEKKGLSPESARAIAEKLGLNSLETELFVASVEATHSRSKLIREAAKKKLEHSQSEESRKIQQLSVDSFRVISEWYHLAILECLKLGTIKGRKTKAEQLELTASHLSLPLNAVEDAAERLLRLELVELRGKKLQACQDTVFSTDGIPSSANRKFHQQILQKAIHAITHQSVEERYFRTSLIPLKESNLSKMKKEIEAFHASLLTKYGEKTDGDTVYAYSSPLFKLTSDKD